MSLDRVIVARRSSEGQSCRLDRLDPVTGYAEARRLPRGWTHLLLQIAVWFGFYVAYQAARGAADRGVGEAFWNGTLVIETENRLRLFIEPTVQDFVERSGVLVAATTYTYWLSQFAVVGLSLLWAYFKHHDRFADFRNWLIGANLLGLVGYVLMPTAPPRMFPEWGFTDTLSDIGSINQQSDVVSFAANPYAAMPSLHAMDALIVGLVMATVCRSRVARVLWLVWPAWVCFAVIGTGNHFWLDCLAGFALASLTGLILFRRRIRQFVPGL
jgi:membrane-associated phospholipid phosphatase